MSIDEIIVHAGLPKTATTAIQNALFSQKSLLLDAFGMLYPGQTANHTNDLCSAFLRDPSTHVVNRLSATPSAELEARAMAIRESLEEEIRTTQPRRVLLSAEGLSNLGYQDLNDLRHWLVQFCDRIRVIYVLRDPLDYTASVVQQHLTQGEVLEDLYQAPPLPNFRGRLETATSVFGREALELLTFEGLAEHADGVVGGFLDAIGLDAPEARAAVLSHQGRLNESLCQVAAEVLSRLNQLRPVLVDGKRGALRTLNEAFFLRRLRGEKFRLPDHVVAQVAEWCAEDVRWLSDTFGVDRYNGFADRPRPSPLPGLPNDTLEDLALLLSDLINEREVAHAGSRLRNDPGADEKALLALIARLHPRPAPVRNGNG